MTGILAALVRIVFFVQFSQTPFAAHLFLDSAHYDRWAGQIRQGDWWGGPGVFFVEPGYAYLLAVVKACGGGITTIRLAQGVLGLGIALLTAALARRLSGSRSVALGAGVIAALYLPLIYFEGLVLKTTLEVFLTSLGLLLFILSAERPRPALTFITGAVAGLAVLIRSTCLPLAVLGAGWLWWSLRRVPSGRPWRSVVLLAAGLLPGLGLVGVRNHAVAGEWVFLPYNSGINFYIGNGRYADGAMGGVPFIRYDPQFEEGDARREAERRVGHPLPAAAVSGFWWSETWRDIRRSPMHWLGLLGKKFLLFWNRYELTDDVSFYFVRLFVPILRWPLPGFWLLGPVGLLALAAGVRYPDPAWRLTAGFIVIPLAGVMIFHFAERYRLAAVPMMIALGMAVLARIVARRKLPAAAAAAAGLGILLAALPNPVYPAGQDLANHHAMLGVAWKESGQSREALDEFRLALELKPADPANLFNLALAAETLEKNPARAETLYRRLLRLKPDHGEASSRLGHVLRQLGRHDEAGEAFCRAAALGFEPGPSFINAAAAFGQAKRYDRADDAVNRGLRLLPHDAHALEIQGNIRYAQGDIAGAGAAWQRSLQLQPDNPALQRNFQALPRAEK